MRDRATRLFLRWRDRDQVDALAKLFDRVAPELLRLASHLTRDVAAAEDLLQDTFLAAIESADRFEGKRSVTPWLAGILTNRAKSERRRSRRSPDLGADGDQVSGTEPQPADGVADRELSDTARNAIERLREPFREPTLLRLVHGMEPAEIALVLDRSPATVRSQIHRGLEMARRALPAGLATALAATAMTATRGLAAIRTEVIAAGARLTAAKAAAGAAAATGAGITVLGIVMSKQTVVLTALVAVCATVLGVAWWPGEDDTPRTDHVAAPAPTPSSVEPSTPTRASDRSVTPAAAERVAAPVVDAVVEAAWTLDVQVIDGVTRQPIEGADLALFGPRELTLLELQRELAGTTQMGATGIPHDLGESVRIPRDLPLDVTLRGAEHPFLVPPRDETQPAILRRTTDSDGRCALPVPLTGVVVEARADGRAPRRLAFEGDPTAGPRIGVVRPTTSTDGATNAGLTISLWPVRELVGFVLTDHEELVPEPLRLRLEGEGGQWFTETDGNGRFTARVGATSVSVTCLTPGWTVTRNIIKQNGQRWITSTSLSTDEAGTVHVTRWGGARIHVTDKATGRPIETIRIRSADDNGTPRHTGTFHAEDGWFALAPFRAQQVLEMPREHRGVFPSQLDVTVWAEGYRPAVLQRIELFGADLQPHEVQLEPGAPARFAGHVVRGTDPVAGVDVQLRPFNQLNWQHNTECVIDAATTTGEGQFELTAPAGNYLCEVFVGELCEAQFAVAVANGDDDRVIDLAGAVHVEVHVVGPDGNPRADHNVAVGTVDHQQRSTRTDAAGKAVLGPFAPGKLKVFAPRQTAEHSWVGAIVENIEAAAGERPVVELRIPANPTIRPFLAFAGEGPDGGFQGFRARASAAQVENHEPVDVGADGSVPLDLVPEAYLYVTAPDGRRWSLQLPKDAQPGYVFTLRWTGLAIAGVVTVAGEPLANGRVYVNGQGQDGTTVSVRTDAEGRFRAEGLDARQMALTFHADPTARHVHVRNPFEKQRFRCDALPSRDPTPLRIDLVPFRDGRYVGREEVTITGRTIDNAKKPVTSAIVGGRTHVPQHGGTLELHPVSGWQSTGKDGSFRIVLTRGPSYTIAISRAMGQPLRDQPLTIPASRTEIERDFVVR